MCGLQKGNKIDPKAILEWVLMGLAVLFAAAHMINMLLYAMRAHVSVGAQQEIDQVIALSLSPLIILWRVWCAVTPR